MLLHKLVLTSLLSCTVLAVAKTHAACVCDLTYALTQGPLCFSAEVLVQRPLQQRNFCNGLAPVLHAKTQILSTPIISNYTTHNHFVCQ